MFQHDADSLTHRSNSLESNESFRSRKSRMNPNHRAMERYTEKINQPLHCSRSHSPCTNTEEKLLNTTEDDLDRLTIQKIKSTPCIENITIQQECSISDNHSQLSCHISSSKIDNESNYASPFEDNLPLPACIPTSHDHREKRELEISCSTPLSSFTSQRSLSCNRSHYSQESESIPIFRCLSNNFIDDILSDDNNCGNKKIQSEGPISSQKLCNTPCHSKEVNVYKNENEDKERNLLIEKRSNLKSNNTIEDVPIEGTIEDVINLKSNITIEDVSQIDLLQEENELLPLKDKVHDTSYPSNCSNKDCTVPPILSLPIDSLRDKRENQLLKCNSYDDDSDSSVSSHKNDISSKRKNTIKSSIAPLQIFDSPHKRDNKYNEHNFSLRTISTDLGSPTFSSSRYDISPISSNINRLLSPRNLLTLSMQHSDTMNDEESPRNIHKRRRENRPLRQKTYNSYKNNDSIFKSQLLEKERKYYRVQIEYSDKIIDKNQLLKKKDQHYLDYITENLTFKKRYQQLQGRYSYFILSAN